MGVVLVSDSVLVMLTARVWLSDSVLEITVRLPVADAAHVKWNEIAAFGRGPDSRAYHAMAFDSSMSLVVVNEIHKRPDKHRRHLILIVLCICWQIVCVCVCVKRVESCTYGAVLRLMASSILHCMSLASRHHDGSTLELHHRTCLPPNDQHLQLQRQQLPLQPRP
jgi:hypothetical protein